MYHYSITSSAATSSVFGTVRPSAFAVLALITSSNLVGCITGRLGLETIAVQARNAHEIEEACAELERRGAESLVTGTDPILLDRRVQIVAYAARRSIPAIYYVQQFAAAGGLLSYGPSISWMYRQAGAYVAQILKGRRPVARIAWTVLAQGRSYEARVEPKVV
jgi:ABC-type uncharacterized transport system substrate-binding protein